MPRKRVVVSLESARALNELQIMWAGVGSVESWTRRKWRRWDRVVKRQGRYEETRCAEESRRQN